MNDKIMTLHPDGKAGVNINVPKYELIKEAILVVIRELGEVTFTDLVAAVDHRLAGQFDGSIAWYVTTVKLDLEARTIIERIPGHKPQQLRLTNE